MKEYLQTIAANAHKVPGLEMLKDTTSTRSTIFQIRIGGLLEGYMSAEYKPVTIRSGLLLIVDAIEAAGLVRFDRSSFFSKRGPGYVLWSANWRDKSDYHVAQNEQDHIALAQCLANTLEALPERKEEKNK